MGAPARGWRVFWGVLAALGTGAWLVGIGGFGMAVSHPGLAAGQDWIEWTAILAVGSAFACASAALFLRGSGDARQGAIPPAFAWGALAALGAFQVALVALAWSDLPATAAALALAAGALPAAVAVARAIVRAARQPSS